MPDIPPFHGRPTQPPGLTYLQYSPDGKRLITAGCGNYAKSFRTGEDGEPNMLIETHDDTYAVASGNDYVILGSEDGYVCQYILPSGDLDKNLFRTTLPIRDLALHFEEKWLAVSSE
jgi:chromosome transmission fidelity protein 4